MICPKCVKEFVSVHGNQKYCSVDCQRRTSSDKYYSLNKDKIIVANKKYRLEVLDGISLSFWRTVVIPHVISLSKSKCSVCGSKCFLEVHHERINLMCPSLMDLVCVCKSCHRKFHEGLRRKAR